MDKISVINWANLKLMFVKTISVFVRMPGKNWLLIVPHKDIIYSTRNICIRLTHRLKYRLKLFCVHIPMQDTLAINTFLMSLIQIKRYNKLIHYNYFEDENHSGLSEIKLNCNASQISGSIC